MDEELVQFHDGELSEPQAAGVRASLATDPQRQAELADIEQTDQALADLDRLAGPTPEGVERGKADFQSALRAAFKAEQLYQDRAARHRRSAVAVAAVLVSVAAAIAIVLALQDEPVIGTVYYYRDYGVEEDDSGELLRLGAPVHAPGGTEADLHIAGVARVRLGENGTIVIGDEANELKLLSGSAEVTSLTPVRFSFADNSYVVTVAAHSHVKILLAGQELRLTQYTGSSRVTGASKQRVVAASGKLVLDLDGPFLQAD